MPAPQEILELVARFERHHEAYKAGSYNETQLRRDYLDPFFKALGWDMDNSAGYDEAPSFAQTEKHHPLEPCCTTT